MTRSRRNGRELPWTSCTCQPRLGLHSDWCQESGRPSLLAIGLALASLLGAMLWLWVVSGAP